MPPVRVGKPGIDEQIRTGGRTAPGARIERAPQLADLPQQQIGLRRAHLGLLREQLQALLIQLHQRLERLGPQPRCRKPGLFTFSPCFHLATQ
ncbi:MAG: hypothetical protein E6K52_02965 [Gammaproteobacteria bacterium]|nr:MAG: hypothetical protein E6K52_02965 [Gammaproteobacteria bacterium]